MMVLLQALAALVIFFAVKYGTYWLTEVKRLPEWLNYRPFSCNLCLTFWSLMGIYTTLWLSFVCLNYMAIYGIILTILNAIAMHIDQRQRTITLDEWEDLKK